MFKRFLIIISTVLMIYRLFKGFEYTSTKEVTKLTIKTNGEEDLIDELESMDEPERKEFIDGMVAELHEGEAGQIEKPKIKVRAKSQNNNINLSSRQSQILNSFEDKSKVDTDILSSKMKDVSVRTIRRDLDKLVEMKLIKKVGNTRGAYYIRS